MRWRTVAAERRRDAVELGQPRGALQRRAHRIVGMIRIVERRAEHRDDRVADVLVDEAAMRLDDVGHGREIFVHRIAVLGHSEGGAVGMLAAAKDNRIAALALVAALGMTGAELNLAQVKHVLETSRDVDAEKQATVELQKQIQTAVLTGKGWEDIPAELRKQVESPGSKAFSPSIRRSRWPTSISRS